MDRWTAAPQLLLNHWEPLLCWVGCPSYKKGSERLGCRGVLGTGVGWGVGTAMVLLTPHSKTLQGVTRLLSGLSALLAPKYDQKVWSLAGKWAVPNTYS